MVTISRVRPRLRKNFSGDNVTGCMILSSGPHVSRVGCAHRKLERLVGTAHPTPRAAAKRQIGRPIGSMALRERPRTPKDGRSIAKNQKKLPMKTKCLGMHPGRCYNGDAEN